MESKLRHQIGSVLNQKHLLSTSLTSSTDCNFKVIASCENRVDANGPYSAKYIENIYLMRSK